MKLTKDFLHEDKGLLEASEAGDDKLIENILSKGVNVNQVDHLGRNALHLAVMSGNERAIVLLLEAGIATTVKDNVGMTPLSLCLMRNPSLKIARLLFDYGAYIVPRARTTDTGLFLQFIMMCTPTQEEEKIIYLLIEKGAQVDDMEAPGQRQALHFAAMSNNCDLVRILFHLGANPNLLNHRNETAYEVAKIYKCKEAAALIARLTRFESSGEFSADQSQIKPTDKKKESADNAQSGHSLTQLAVEPSTPNLIRK